jgi:hypothetical protein
MKKFLFAVSLLFVGLVASPVFAQDDAAPGEIGGASKDGGIIFDSFEDETTYPGWKAVADAWAQWGDLTHSSVDVEVVTAHATDQGHALKMNFKINGLLTKGDKPENRLAFLNQPASLPSMAGAKTIKCDIFNDSKIPVTLILVNQDNVAWAWNAAPVVTINPGANSVVIDVSKVDKLDKIGSIIFDFYADAKVAKGTKGSLYLDNVRYFK